MAYSNLLHFIKEGNLIVFFDLEATQFTHKAIALGFVAYEKKIGEVSFDLEKKMEYHAYIKQEDEIGPVVEELTGIHPETLQKEGKDFHQVVLEVSKMLRPYKKKFLSYGSMDIRILNESIDKQDETERNFYRNVIKNYLDFHMYISKRICDKHGQSYSISSLLKLYGLEIDGPYHNPLMDSLALSKIYYAYVNDEKKDIELYLQNYAQNRNTNAINKKLALRVLEQNQVSKDDLIMLLRDNL